MFVNEVMEFLCSAEQNQKSKVREKEKRSEIYNVKLKEFQERTDREDREEINQGQKGTMLCKLKEDLCPHTKKAHETVNKKTENVTFEH